jgi:hypothetical protein
VEGREDESASRSQGSERLPEESAKTGEVLRHESAEERIEAASSDGELAAEIRLRECYTLALSLGDPEHPEREIEADGSAPRTRHQTEIRSRAATRIENSLPGLGSKQVHRMTAIERHERVRSLLVRLCPSIVSLTNTRSRYSSRHERIVSLRRRSTRVGFNFTFG